MKTLTKTRPGRIAMLVVAGALAIAGGAYAAEMSVGKSLDPIQGTLFTINNASIVNSAVAQSSTSYITRASRVGPTIHRLELNNVVHTNAENTWQEYE